MMPEERQQDDDGDWYSQQPQKHAATETHDRLLFLFWSGEHSGCRAAAGRSLPLPEPTIV
jgi:hypothetical protein